jgi:hypothetical protein
MEYLMKKLFVAAVLAFLSACAPAAEPVQAAPAPATTQVAAPATTTPEPAVAGECATLEWFANRHVIIDPLPGVTFTKITRPGAPRRDWPKGAEVQGMLTQFSNPGEVVIEGMGPNGPCRQVFKVT